MSQINQQFGTNFKVTDAENKFLFAGSDSSLQFQIDEDTEQYAILSVTRSTSKNVVLDDCFKLNSQEVSWYGGPQQKYQYWPIDRLNLKDYSYITKEADNCGVAERYWLNSRGIFIYVDADAPLFLNQAPMESLCLTVEKKLPYYTHDNATITFNYKIGVAANARQAHMMAIDKFLKVGRIVVKFGCYQAPNTSPYSYTLFNGLRNQLATQTKEWFGIRFGRHGPAITRP